MMDPRAKALLDFWFGPGEAPRAVWFEPDFSRVEVSREAVAR